MDTKYSILQVLKQDAACSVTQVKCKETSNLFLAKIFVPEYVKLALEEIKCLKKVSDMKNVIQLLSVFEHNSHMYLLFPWIATQNTYQVLTQTSLIVRYQWFQTLHTTIKALHTQGLLHRDIKPANILFAAHGPTIIDFGQSGPIGQVCVKPIGTCFYRSPDMIAHKALYPASDYWSLYQVWIDMLFPDMYVLKSRLPSSMESSWMNVFVTSPNIYVCVTRIILVFRGYLTCSEVETLQSQLKDAPEYAITLANQACFKI